MEIHGTKTARYCYEKERKRHREAEREIGREKRREGKRKHF